MRIDCLTLTNFRSFERWNQTFTPGFNVLIGANGSGKTGVLDGLAVSLGAFIAGFRGYEFRRIDDEDIRLVPSGSEDDQTLEPQFPCDIKIEGCLNEESVTWRRWVRQGDSIVRGGNTLKIRGIAKKMEEGLTDDTILPLIAYYPTNRLWTGRIPSRTISIVFNKSEKATVAQSKSETPTRINAITRLSGYRTCLYAQAHEREVRAWLRRLELGSLQRKIKNPTLDAVKGAVSGLLEHWSEFYYDAQLEDLVVRNKNNEIMLARLLSHGQRNILFMVADLAYRCARLNPKLRGEGLSQTPGVVLIDELDLHLHPNWQRRIVNDLRQSFPQIQFIVATHSPVILQSLNRNSDQIIRLGDTNPPTEDYVDRPIEDIMVEVQGYLDTVQSDQKRAMIAAAEEYYRTLQQAANASPRRLARLKQKMDELALPYHDNPAYIAFLNMKRQAILGDKN